MKKEHPNQRFKNKEYIEADGRQMIITNEKFDTDHYEYGIDFVATRTPYHVSLLSGWLVNGLDSNWGGGSYFANNNNLRCWVGSSGNILGLGVYSGVRYIHNSIVDKINSYVYQSANGEGRGATFTGTINPDNYMAFLGSKYGTNNPIYCMYAKVYSAYIKKNGVLVRDYVPMLDKFNNKAGLYDNITGEFLTSVTSYDFLYPREYSYTDLEYIQSTGTQYINTGFKPNNNTEVIYSCRQTESYAYNNAQTFFGCSNGTWIDNPIGVSTYHNGSYGWGGLGTAGWGTFTVTVGEDTVYKINNVGFYRNDILIGNTTPYTISQMNRNLLFCAENFNSITEYGKHRIYYAKIYDNGTLVRDFVPKLRDDGIPGLYDLVNNVFYINQGTGEFLYA